MDIIAKTCSTECWGTEGAHGGCCRVDDRDWIMGPIHDTIEVLEGVKKEKPWVTWGDLFMEFGEGASMYPEKSVYQNTIHYPAMKIIDGACAAYNKHLRTCSIYENRPTTCRNYECGYLRERHNSQNK